jgi:hypothetical protein
MTATPPPLTDQQLAIRRYRAAWLSARNRSAGYQQRYRYERKLCRSADIRATKAIRAQLVAEHSEALALAEARRLRAERDQARARAAAAYAFAGEMASSCDAHGPAGHRCDADRLLARLAAATVGES